ncbi:MAG: carbohydrate ABC transporter permease [Deinococcales bacterium]
MRQKLFALPLSLRLTIWLIVGFWLIIAIFPLLWLVVMSFKLPIDAFDANPFKVILGPITSQTVGGFSLITLVLVLMTLYGLLQLFARREFYFARFQVGLGLQIIFYLGLLALAMLSFPLANFISQSLSNLLGDNNFLTKPIFGLTGQHYHAVWFENGFYKQFLNTMMVTLGVVSISLTIGTLAAYALARSNSSWAFWILLVALVFRAMPHSTLVTGYLPPFIEWGLYGKRIAVIIVLVAINQPFTIWMLRSFFMNIPASLDEAALVDGCNRLQAFRQVIMPIMWPGVITTGLFSFMLAYNDYLVSALLLDGESRTMVPAIMSYFNRETTLTDQLEAIAAAASITFPIFLLVLFFQKQIVSGLTQGAVKG